MNKSKTQRAKRAKLTRSTALPPIRKTVFLFIIFIAQSSFLNYHSLPVGKYSPWHTYEQTSRPQASLDGLHLSLLPLLSLREVKPTKPTDSVTLSCYSVKHLRNSFSTDISHCGMAMCACGLSCFIKSKSTLWKKYNLLFLKTRQISQILNCSCLCVKWIIHWLKNVHHYICQSASVCLTFHFGRDHKIRLLLERTADAGGKKAIIIDPITSLQRTWSWHGEFSIDALYPETGGIHNNMERKTSMGMRWKGLIDKERKIINTGEDLAKR